MKGTGYRAFEWDSRGSKETSVFGYEREKDKISTLFGKKDRSYISIPPANSKRRRELSQLPSTSDFVVVDFHRSRHQTDVLYDNDSDGEKQNIRTNSGFDGEGQTRAKAVGWLDLNQVNVKRRGDYCWRSTLLNVLERTSRC